jgi:hypothetical protein
MIKTILGFDAFCSCSAIKVSASKQKQQKAMQRAQLIKDFMATPKTEGGG